MAIGGAASTSPAPVTPSSGGSGGISNPASSSGGGGGLSSPALSGGSSNTDSFNLSNPWTSSENSSASGVSSLPDLSGPKSETPESEGNSSSLEKAPGEGESSPLEKSPGEGESSSIEKKPESDVENDLAVKPPEDPESRESEPKSENPSEKLEKPEADKPNEEKIDKPGTEEGDSKSPENNSNANNEGNDKPKEGESSPEQPRDNNNSNTPEGKPPPSANPSEGQLPALASVGSGMFSAQTNPFTMNAPSQGFSSPFTAESINNTFGNGLDDGDQDSMADADLPAGDPLTAEVRSEECAEKTEARYTGKELASEGDEVSEADSEVENFSTDNAFCQDAIDNATEAKAFDNAAAKDIREGRLGDAKSNIEAAHLASVKAIDEQYRANQLSKEKTATAFSEAQRTQFQSKGLESVLQNAFKDSQNSLSQNRYAHQNTPDHFRDPQELAKRVSDSVNHFASIVDQISQSDIQPKNLSQLRQLLMDNQSYLA